MDYHVISYLEKTAARVPGKTAIVDEFGAMTYSQVLQASQATATVLCGKIGHGQPVAVYMEKSKEALCTFFGIALAGGFYSVLNTELPDSRFQSILGVLKPSIIITSRDLLQNAESQFPGYEILVAEELMAAEIRQDVLDARRAGCIDTDPLYVNFTSGSTGVPKGIVVGHRSVLDFISCFTEIFSITEEDVIANQAPFDFDVSVKDIFSALRTGATLVVIPRRMFSAPAELVDFLCAHQVTTMIWAVSALCLITTFHALDYKTPETIRKILFSGEVMPNRAMKDLRKHLPDAMYVNLYGPTEITCNCTYHILDKERDYSAGMPIGKAFPNEDVFLLDGEDYRITEPEQIGEICVRGTALALGYFSAPEQNAAHFVQNPLNPNFPERIYRTGDLGRYNELGELVFSGRKDFQIKYMGHRIELEEIEREMAAIAGVERCCCIFDEKKSRLRGFYVGTIDKDTLHRTMSQNLPAYMVPGMIRQVDQMPLTKNGKIDRKLLAESGR